MRLFVGIGIPPDIAARIGACVERLKATSGAALGWGDVTELHLTTKFIGEESPERAVVIERALATLCSRAPFRVDVRGFGWFPNVASPRVFWVGVDAPTGLSALAADTDRVLVPLGIAPEQRTYAPHVTLARVRKKVPLDALRRALSALPTTDFGAFTVDHFTLYESRRTDRVRHHAIAAFPFQAIPAPTP